jgi:hypothetical protein
VATFLEANGRGYWEASEEKLERLRQVGGRTCPAVALLLQQQVLLLLLQLLLLPAAAAALRPLCEAAPNRPLAPATPKLTRNSLPPSIPLCQMYADVEDKIEGVE